MKAFAVALALLLGATVPAFAGDPDLEAAKGALQTARARLKAAHGEFDGHRARAVDLVESALQQVDAGLRVDTRHERKEDRKADQLEKKIDKLEKQKDKLEQD